MCTYIHITFPFACFRRAGGLYSLETGRTFIIHLPWLHSGHSKQWPLRSNRPSSKSSPHCWLDQSAWSKSRFLREIICLVPAGSVTDASQQVAGLGREVVVKEVCVVFRLPVAGL